MYDWINVKEFRQSYLSFGGLHLNSAGAWFTKCSACTKHNDILSDFAAPELLRRNLRFKPFRVHEDCSNLIFVASIQYTDLNGRETVFIIEIRHKETGFRLGFSDSRGEVQLHVGFDHDPEKNQKLIIAWIFRNFAQDETDFEVKLNVKAELFMDDVLNGFIPADKSLFYQSSAYASSDLNADSSSQTNSYYTTKPYFCDPNRINNRNLKCEEAKSVAAKWNPIESAGVFPEATLSVSSPLHLLIHNLHKSISSALLFYRLLCLWNTTKTRFTQFSSGSGV
ncbi:hypothetical protein HK098_003360 [Nowakowskiella sp. JEL0407]|nr:hypothetical protein HK098_003360 [Nowakowskiella sp. JEL0407]